MKTNVIECKIIYNYCTNASYMYKVVLAIKLFKMLKINHITINYQTIIDNNENKFYNLVNANGCMETHL